MLGVLCVPIGVASFFAVIMRGSGDKAVSKIPVLIADGDHSAVSEKIVAGIKADVAFTVTEASAAEARAAVGKGSTSVALVIPQGFGQESAQALFSPMAPRPKLTFLYDPAKTSELQMAQGLLTQQVMQVVSQEAFQNPESSGIDSAVAMIKLDPSRDPKEREALVGLLESVQRYGQSTKSGASASGGMGFSNPCEMVKEAVVAKRKGLLGTEESAGVTHVFVGMAVQGLLFFAVDFGITLVRDRRLGLWKRLRAAPLTRATLLASRLVSSALIGLFVLAAVFGFGAAVFGIRVQGSVVGFGLMGIASALMVSGFGMLIAALGRTEAQCRAASVPAVLAMSFLGGAWLPSFMMPGWVQGFAKTLPSRWAIDGFDAMTWRGLDLVDSLAPVGILLAFTLAFTTIAFARFRWDAD